MRTAHGRKVSDQSLSAEDCFQINASDRWRLAGVNARCIVLL